MTLFEYILGYFSAMFFIYLANKYYIEEDWMNGVKKISFFQAALLSLFSWIVVTAFTLAGVGVFILNTKQYKKINSFFTFNNQKG